MTDEQIIEMAKQSGLHVATDVNWMPVIGLAYAKKLVEVATQHEREACARVCDDVDSISDYYELRIELICAEAIRERGEI